MAGKKDAKQKAGPRDRTEKSKEKSSEGTKNIPRGSGQSEPKRAKMAGKKDAKLKAGESV
jgi:hypothetical protein